MEITINNKRPSLITLPDGTDLVPGPNKVKRETIEKYAEHAGVQALFDDDSGFLEIVGDDAKPLVPDNLNETLEDLKLPEALKTIEATDDLNQLEKWAATDSRKGVQQGIADRLVELDRD